MAVVGLGVRTTTLLAPPVICVLTVSVAAVSPGADAMIWSEPTLVDGVIEMVAMPPWALTVWLPKLRNTVAEFCVKVTGLVAVVTRLP